MGKKKAFPDLTPAKEQEYTRLARLQYDPKLVNESVVRWNGYGENRKAEIKEEGQEIYKQLGKALRKGKASEHEDVQALIVQWHQHIQYFYEPTTEILRGLGDLYVNSPDFANVFSAIEAGLPEYLQAAITVYVNELEDAELQRLIAEDDAKHGYQ